MLLISRDLCFSNAFHEVMILLLKIYSKNRNCVCFMYCKVTAVILTHLSEWTTSVLQGNLAHLRRPEDQPDIPPLLCGTAFCGSPRLWAHTAFEILHPRTAGVCWFYLLWVRQAQLFGDSSWAWSDPSLADPRAFLEVDHSIHADAPDSMIYLQSFPYPVVSSAL